MAKKGKKRLNYYQVHLNKKPCKILKTGFKTDVKTLKTVLVSVISALRIKTIIENPFLNKLQKAHRVALDCLNTAEAITNIFRNGSTA